LAVKTTSEMTQIVSAEVSNFTHNSSSQWLVTVCWYRVGQKLIIHNKLWAV